MKQLITTLSILLSVFAISTNTQAQIFEIEDIPTCQIRNTPDNFTKAKFKKALKQQGINKTNAKQIKGLKKMVNSLAKKNGKWYVQATSSQLNALKKASNGKIRVLAGDKNSWLEMTPYD